MRHLISAALILTLLLSPLLPAQAEDRPAIITLNFPAYDFSRRIAGERADISLLLPPGMDAHSFEPSPRDLIALQEADLLVYNGGIGENWVKNLLASMGEQAPRALVMMEQVETVTEELVAGMEDAPHAHGEDEPGHGDAAGHEEVHEEEHEEERELDEHVWTTPGNAARIAAAIAEALSALDPAGSEVYAENLSAYQGELELLDRDFREMVDSAKRKTIILGDRFPMRYFTMAYGLSYFAAFPGCSAQTEPSAKTIAFLMDTMKQERLPVVFYIEFSNRKAADLIAQETSAKTLLLHSAHNVTAEELASGITYLDIMRNNLENLREALN